MNQETTTQFCITENEEGMSVHIEGGAQDLVNLLSNAIYKSDEIETVVTMALIAVTAKRESKGNNDSENFLNEILSKIKPTAQA
jgi:hypothetical protein